MRLRVAVPGYYGVVPAVGLSCPPWVVHLADRIPFQVSEICIPFHFAWSCALAYKSPETKVHVPLWPHGAKLLVHRRE